MSDIGRGMITAGERAAPVRGRWSASAAARRMAAGAALLTMAAVAPELGAQDVGLKVGARAPAVSVETLEGAKVDLGSYFGKTPVIIEFWATWCPNCKDLEPAMRAARAKYGKQVRFVGVAVGVNQSTERVKRYSAKYQVPFEVLYDRRGDAVEAFNVPATSYIVVIDSAGRIVYTGLGGDQDVDAAIRRAL